MSQSIWDIEDEVKEFGHGLRGKLARQHLGAAVAHLRQAIREHLYEEGRTVLAVQNEVNQGLLAQGVLEALSEESEAAQ